MKFGAYPSESSLRNIGMVVGLGHGDEGKGMSALTYAYYHATANQNLIACKGNGSGQATHKVMMDLRPEYDAGDYWFIHSYYSGATFAPLATMHKDIAPYSTILTPDIVIDLITLYEETRKINSRIKDFEIASKETLERPTIYVHNDSWVTTPLDIQFNILREMFNQSANSGKHGTCGIGFFDTLTRSRNLFPIHVSRIMDDDYRSYDDMLAIYKYYTKLLHEKLASTHVVMYPELQDAIDKFFFMADNDIGMLSASFDYYCAVIRDCVKLKTFNIEVYSDFASIVNKYDTLLIESNQGVLIGNEHGIMPHATPSDTTGKTTLSYVATCLEESGTYLDDIKFTYVGISRIFSTRHGNGPFVHKNAIKIPEVHREHVNFGFNMNDMPNSKEILTEEHNVFNTYQGGMRWSPLSVDNLAFVYNDFNKFLNESGLIHKFKTVSLTLNLSHLDALYHFGGKFEYISGGVFNSDVFSVPPREYVYSVPRKIVQMINNQLTDIKVTTGVTATGPHLQHWIGGYSDF